MLTNRTICEADRSLVDPAPGFYSSDSDPGLKIFSSIKSFNEVLKNKRLDKSAPSLDEKVRLRLRNAANCCGAGGSQEILAGAGLKLLLQLRCKRKNS